MKRSINQNSSQTGAGAVEYFVAMALIILATFIAIYVVGSGTSETIQEAGSAISGDSTAININTKQKDEPIDTCGNNNCDPTDAPECTDCANGCTDIQCNPCQTLHCPPLNGKSCVTDDAAGGCAENEHCSEGSCVPDDACLEVICEKCETCDSGQCSPIEDGNSCGLPCHSCISGECAVDDAAGGCPDEISSFCQSGECVIIDDSCNGVNCPECQICDSGTCIPLNQEHACGACQSCSEGECVPDDSDYATCESTQCSLGYCVSVPHPCDGVECLACETCVEGTCVEDPESPVPCP